MKNQKLKSLITDWRNKSYGLTNEGQQPGLSNDESWIMASTLEQCADELGALILMDEKYLHVLDIMKRKM